jgi:hypothetical protein
VVSSCWIWFPFIQLRDHLLMDIYVNAWFWCIGTASINIWGITELMSPWAHPLNLKIVALCLEFSSLCRFFYYILNVFAIWVQLKFWKRVEICLARESRPMPHLICCTCLRGMSRVWC